MVVVIPVCNEPEMLRTLDSLAACNAPNGTVEVFLVVNESELASSEVIRQNVQTMIEVETWKKEHPSCFLGLQVFHPEAFPRKRAGAGLARKTGMDEAIRRFHHISKPDGILVSLDADTIVEPNYLVAIQQAFSGSPKPVGATVRFQHCLDEITDARHLQGMELYETYLHYYKQALQFTGYPHAIYTVGSAFAVRADAYVKQGGMSKCQAGEDFYFLHKLTALGPIAEINSTCVYPSARLSDRVPFGTGPSLQKWMDGDDGLRVTYALQAFVDLKRFFSQVPCLYDNLSEVESLQLAESITQFLAADGFSKALAEIRQNSASWANFEKRFFQYFNAFKILKFLNFTHPAFYSFQDLKEAYLDLKSC